MIPLLVSQQFLDDYDHLITGVRERHGVRFEPVLLPLTGADPPLAQAECDRVEVALLSRDVLARREAFARVGELSGRLTNLQWLHFGNAGAGPYPWMRPLYARGVKITSSAGANAEPVAQSALFGMMYLARRAYRWLANYPERAWKPQAEPDVPPDLAGQTVMILGLGNVGTHFARFARALRMHVIGVRRSPRRPDEPVDEIEPPQRILQLLPRCDWLVITCPLTRETRGLIGREAIACMKPTAQIINVGRGEVTDEQALVAALVAGRLGGAHFDVFSEEPLPASSSLWSLPNVLITPHNAAAAKGNGGRAAEIFLDNLVRYSRAETLRNPVPE